MSSEDGQRLVAGRNVVSNAFELTIPRKNPNVMSNKRYTNIGIYIVTHSACRSGIAGLALLCCDIKGAMLIVIKEPQ